MHAEIKLKSSFVRPTLYRFLFEPVPREAATGALMESCLGAIDLLLHLSEQCPALMSPYANAVGDLVLGGAGA